jgi:hypothetical protein
VDNVVAETIAGGASHGSARITAPPLVAVDQASASHAFRSDYDVAVVNGFFRRKMRRYLGWPGLAAHRIVNLIDCPSPSGQTST